MVATSYASQPITTPTKIKRLRFHFQSIVPILSQPSGQQFAPFLSLCSLCSFAAISVLSISSCSISLPNLCFIRVHPWLTIQLPHLGYKPRLVGSKLRLPLRSLCSFAAISVPFPPVQRLFRIRVLSVFHPWLTIQLPHLLYKPPLVASKLPFPCPSFFSFAPTSFPLPPLQP